MLQGCSQKDTLNNTKRCKGTPTTTEPGCSHTENPSAGVSGQDTPIGSHGSRGLFSICQGQAGGQRVQPG